MERMRDRVVPLTHIRGPVKTVVVGRIEGLSSPNFSVPRESVPREMENGLPAWALNPPTIEDRLTAVGTAETRYALGESIRAADRSAMANLARRRRLRVENLSDQLKRGGSSAYRELNLEDTEAVLEGFYVLARWYSPEENLYYSLAVCSQAE
jgi:hypothetical protein